MGRRKTKQLVIKMLPDDYFKDGDIYCGICKTRKSVNGIFPKMCKCQCEQNGYEWVDDSKIERV